MYIEKMVHSLSDFTYKKIFYHTQKSKVSRLRQKDQIKVLYMMPCLQKWKTESLYLAMVKHPRFLPVIGVPLMSADYPSESFSKYHNLLDYLNAKNYSFYELKDKNDLRRISPDIVFLQEAAGGGIREELLCKKYTECLYCYVSYAFETVKIPQLLNTFYQNICWQNYSESDIVIDSIRDVMDNHGRNLLYTGVPTSDQLMQPETSYINPWRNPSEKKRIIWAPHHTIDNHTQTQYSTFLMVADAMLQLSQKYSDKVQWAFKPHPALRSKLNGLWGKEKTDQYYNYWENSDCTQFEDGEYIGLFKYSDAIIHDCGSFTVEYLYMKKPCMYLVNGENHDLNPFGEKCYNQYYFGRNEQDIEKFVINVINGVDSRKQEREVFFNKYLQPPHGKTASENIINAILGQEEYSYQ